MFVDFHGVSNPLASFKLTEVSEEVGVERTAVIGSYGLVGAAFSTPFNLESLT